VESEISPSDLLVPILTFVQCPCHVNVALYRISIVKAKSV